MSNINEQIGEKIAGFLTGELSLTERDLLRQWVEASEENRQYFEEMKTVWQAAGTGDTSKTYLPEEAWQKVLLKTGLNFATPASLSENGAKGRRDERASPTWSIRRALQIAAAIAVIFLGGATTGYFLFKTDLKQGEGTAMMDMFNNTTVMVPRGAKSTVVLPDGSKVVLNAASQVIYDHDYGLSSREITLEGEAYFDVKSNPEKPFTVHTSHIDIQAFGTAFNVKAYPEDQTIVTTLEHGDVKITSRKDNSLVLPLKPKQNAVYYKDTNTAMKQATNSTTPSAVLNANVPPVTVTEQVNINLYTSWKDAEWLIESKTFGELAGLLERRYDIRILFGSNDIKNYRFSGTIRNETIEQLLNALTLTTPLNYSIDQGIVRLQIDVKRKRNFDTLSR